MKNQKPAPKGYLELKERKITGSHYTPKKLSDFVAEKITQVLNIKNDSVLVLDPAMGDGELLISLIDRLKKKTSAVISVHGVDIDTAAIEVASKRLNKYPEITTDLKHKDFLGYALEQNKNDLFTQSDNVLYDAVIANPPYIRTQVLGSDESQRLSEEFGLKGRVDLYHAFILGISMVLKPGGVLGIIVSNRFMTTRSGESLRRNILSHFDILSIWDFGDTHLFDAAVLPAVLLLRKKSGINEISQSTFTTIYSTKKSNTSIKACGVFEALEFSGIIEVENKGFYEVQHGKLNVDTDKISSEEVWHLSNGVVDGWLDKVDEKTYMRFADIGKIKVGVKTTADKVFIRSDWDEFGDDEKPELLRHLTTHHVARRFKPLDNGIKRILYPHESTGGIRKPVDLKDYPKSAKYLYKNREILESRDYVVQAGRKWYEMWVPHDPLSWNMNKIVFRDISERPTFWLDVDKTIVNGDCYWFSIDDSKLDIAWLALAVSNSTFIESFYDRKFNNKLYSGRRRFMSQYVEQFPLPDPKSQIAKKIIDLSRTIYSEMGNIDTSEKEEKLDGLIWESFGVRSSI